MAGDLGCLTGSIYTSFTGFYTADGTGTAQLVATGLLLQRAGFKMWDLGMGGDQCKYKTEVLRATNMARPQFVERFQSLRDRSCNLSVPTPVAVGDLIAAVHSTPPQDVQMSAERKPISFTRKSKIAALAVLVGTIAAAAVRAGEAVGDSGAEAAVGGVLSS
eukprot:NODE_1283_length_988_cov_174.485623_g985_i0.p1 GENE.NODE_1283_length_988_cov_174.485623_g985_i0~~NODE_1283_length_988_cov_174.485623_g985_i0.p1  ORF type:complete len:162 (+),score=35.22 NODE_1283_length_988_cov_174.485623_g985_i0:348-833(+)